MSVKSLKPSDKISRPFVVYKNWNVDTVSNDSLLLLECGDPIATCYTTASTSGSCLNINNDFSNISLATEQQEWNGLITIDEGIKNNLKFYDSSSIYYNEEANPINTSGTYKRSVYNLVKSKFYESSSTIFNLFGLETIDYDEAGNPLEKRNIGDRVTVGNIRSTYGEKIVPNSLKIVDYSFGDDVYTIEDDGNSNLILTDRTFRYRYELQLKENSDVYDVKGNRFGYDLDANANYLAVGIPAESGFVDSQLGRVNLYKFDNSTNRHRFVKQLISIDSQASLAHELSISNDHLIELEQGDFLFDNNPRSTCDVVADGYGNSVAINDKWLVVGAYKISECFDSCEESGSGRVYVYDNFKGGSDNWGLINVLQGGSPGDMFGFSVAVDDDTIAIGSPGVSGSGAVYVFRRKIFMDEDACLGVVTSSFYQVLEPEWDFETGEFTSSKCSNLINESQSFASLYDLYEEVETPHFIAGNNTFLLEQIISPPRNEIGFGYDVDISGDTIVVGTSNPNSDARVYTFEYTSSSECSGSWIPTCEISRLTTINSDDSGIRELNSTPNFGRSVSISDSFIAVGSPNDLTYQQYSGSNFTFEVGSVYLYSRGEIECSDCCVSLLDEESECDWNFRQKIEGIVDTSVVNYFGYDVDLSVNRLLIGSPNIMSTPVSYSSSYDIADFEVKEISGKSYLYRISDDRQNYTFEKEISKNSLEDSIHQRFGSSVALTENSVFVGAPAEISVDSASSDFFTSSIFLEDNFYPQVSGSVYEYLLDDLESKLAIGNVFYKNGLITITDNSPLFSNILTGYNEFGFELEYQSQYTIFENEYLIRVEPGEFNVSQNPTALVRNPIEFDINGDGKFDIEDLDLILRYINKFKNFKTTIKDEDNGIVTEQDLHTNSNLSELSEKEAIIKRVKSFEGEEAWWNNDLILTESEDVILLESADLDSFNLSVTENVRLNKLYLETLEALDGDGKLDFNGDGQTDSFDANILWNYFIGQRGMSMTDGNVSPQSKRKFAYEIVDFISQFTGENNGLDIHPNFHNYLESSSYDRTGSYLSPYVTGIGLYDADNNLVAVSKLGKPIKILQDYPINFNVRIDS